MSFDQAEWAYTLFNFYINGIINSNKKPYNEFSCSETDNTLFF